MFQTTNQFWIGSFPSIPYTFSTHVGNDLEIWSKSSHPDVCSPFEENILFLTKNGGVPQYRMVLYGIYSGKSPSKGLVLVGEPPHLWCLYDRQKPLPTSPGYARRVCLAHGCQGLNRDASQAKSRWCFDFPLRSIRNISPLINKIFPHWEIYIYIYNIYIYQWEIDQRNFGKDQMHQAWNQRKSPAVRGNIEDLRGSLESQ